MLIATPMGTAISSGDFFIPPSPYAAPDVGFTSRMAMGDITTATLGVANKIAMILFDGAAGQQVALRLTAVTITSTRITILEPNGTTQVSSTTVGTSGARIYTSPLLTTGTYTILIDPDSSYSGAMTLNLANENATVTASLNSVVAGGSLTANWTDIPFPTSQDWIGLFTPTAANTAHSGYRWTTGATSGSVPFTIPTGTAPGTYELRLFPQNSYVRIATSSTFTVTACTGVTLNVSPNSVVAGGSVTASWSGICVPATNDWIGLYTPGASDNSYVKYQYTFTTGTGTGSVSYSIPASLAAGTYELRLFSQNTYVRLATSSTFTVTP